MDNTLGILMILWLILMWITFLVILMWIIVMMTTPLTVFLSGFASSPEPENTTMVNMEGVVGLYLCWYFFSLLVLLSFLKGELQEVDTNKENKEEQVGIGGSNMR